MPPCRAVLRLQEKGRPHTTFFSCQRQSLGELGPPLPMPACAALPIALSALPQPAPCSCTHVVRVKSPHLYHRAHYVQLERCKGKPINARSTRLHYMPGRVATTCSMGCAVLTLPKGPARAPACSRPAADSRAAWCGPPAPSPPPSTSVAVAASAATQA